MTKEQKIKEAWIQLVGVDNFKKLRLDKDGFSNWQCRILMPDHNYSKLHDRYKIGSSMKSGSDLIYRPLSIINIDNNNGWTKINTRADLPKNEGMYLFHTVHGRNIEQWHSEDISIGGVTHWRQIVKIASPLY